MLYTGLQLSWPKKLLMKPAAVERDKMVVELGLVVR